jgi:hypothetical protein
MGVETAAGAVALAIRIQVEAIGPDRGKKHPHEAAETAPIKVLEIEPLLRVVRRAALGLEVHLTLNADQGNREAGK